jgi:hypothetical protein
MSDTSIPGSPDMSKVPPDVAKHTDQDIDSSSAEFIRLSEDHYMWLEDNKWSRRTMPNLLWVAAKSRLPPTDPAATPPQRRRQEPAADPSTASPIEYTLYSLQAFGFTHPSHGRYLMVPKEFQAILLLETKAVAAVVWEVMQQTIGWEGNGPGGRREWAPLSVRHFARARILSRKHAEKGIARALARGYIERRQAGVRRYEYRLRWKGTN